MPTYTFSCLDCRAVVDVRATIAEKTAGLSPSCSACGGSALRQTFSTVAVIGRPGAGAPAPSGGGCCGGACGCGAG